MVYHLIVAVIGISLLLYGWVWVQEQANHDECEGMTDEAICVIGGDCHGCVRSANAKIDSRKSEDMTVYFEPNNRASEAAIMDCTP